MYKETAGGVAACSPAAEGSKRGATNDGGCPQLRGECVREFNELSV